MTITMKDNKMTRIHYYLLGISITVLFTLISVSFYFGNGFGNSSATIQNIKEDSSKNTVRIDILEKQSTKIDILEKQMNSKLPIQQYKSDKENWHRSLDQINITMVHMSSKIDKIYERGIK